jgi:serine/threonine-protein kinase
VKAIGKYRVRSLLGEGSMGTVYLAHDPDLDREVAVKVMAGASGRDPRLRERLEREARAGAKLHHPNIVTVHDLGYDANGAPFIAMELLDGSDLQHLSESGGLALGRKIEILIQVCAGLAHAHGSGIVHRDIKPANIFVLKDGTAKIMDFGVARWMETQRTQSGLVVGTAGYISPEQLRGKPADGRSDIFSLGVVLFELLTLQALFPGDNIEAVFFKTLGKEAPTVLDPNGKELPALQAILKRSLAKDAEARYGSAEEMRKALRAFADAHPPLLSATAPLTTREREGSPPRRRTSGNAPTRVVRAPSRPRPTPRPTRSYRALSAVALVCAVSALALYTYFVTRPLTSSAPIPEPPVAPVAVPDPPPSPPAEVAREEPPPPAVVHTEPKPAPPRDEPAATEPKAAPQPAPRREFVESRTEHTPPSKGDESEILGFESEPGMEVGEISDSFVPAEVVIEVSPGDAKPGDRYSIRVSLFNTGYRPIRVESLELVSRFGGKTTGKGQRILLSAAEVAPQTTALIYRVDGTWKESLNEGEIETTVALAEGGALTKRLSWRPAPR